MMEHWFACLRYEYLEARVRPVSEVLREIVTTDPG